MLALDELVAQMTDPIDFVRLVNAVHVDVYRQDFQVIDGSRGDNGNDGYVASERRMLAIYCPVKPEQRTDADYRRKIESDLSKAVVLRDAGKYQVDAWTFITPRKLSDDLVGWMRSLGGRHGISVHHQEATFLAGELQRRPHLIDGFPRLAQPRIEEKLDEILRHVRSAPAPSTSAEEQSGRAAATAQQEDEAGQQRWRTLRAGYPSPTAKVNLKALAYATTDPVLEINAIHLLMRWWEPADDDLAELHTFAERGIERARQLGEHGSEAAFHAQKAAFTAFELNRLLIEHRFSTMINVMVGLPPTEEIVRDSERVRNLATSFSAQGSAAVDALMRGASASEVSSTLQILATAVGQTAHALRASGAAAEADQYLAHAKKLFLTAKDASAAGGDELGAVNAMFNLANQIRFHGGGGESLALAKIAREVAEKHGDHLLRQRAEWLIEAIETGKVPAYEKGERREWPSGPQNTAA
jgi:hypothetical protein